MLGFPFKEIWNWSTEAWATGSPKHLSLPDWPRLELTCRLSVVEGLCGHAFLREAKELSPWVASGT